MIYQARAEANEMFISMYETECPKTHPLTWTNHDLELFTKWESSKKEYKVCKSNFVEVRDLIFESTKLESIIDFWKLFEKGIDCTFLKNRLTLTYFNQFSTEMEWFLKPLEDKKENEAVDRVKELEDGLRTIDSMLQYLEDFTHGEIGNKITKTRGEIDTLLKSPFKTRKPNIQEP